MSKFIKLTPDNQSQSGTSEQRENAAKRFPAIKAGYNHPEAYCVMQYNCNCGHAEKLWNSRDGVTPFTIPCPSCGEGMGLVHSNFWNDKFLPDYKPHFGQRIFISMTEEKAKFYAARRLEKLRERKKISDEEAEEISSQLWKSLYANGEAPDIQISGYEEI